MENNQLLNLIYEEIINLTETTSSIKTTLDSMEKGCENKHCKIDKQIEEIEGRTDSLEHNVQSVKTTGRVLTWLIGAIVGGIGLTYTILEIIR